MTFEDLQKANATIKTMTISRWDKKKGVEVTKDYAEVNQRIKAFRMLYPDGFIRTKLLSNENGVCVMVAEVGTGDMVLATGTAYEKESSSQINATSYIENCETSAVGRALGMMGIGIDTSIASYEEVSNAIAQQEKDALAEEVKKAEVATIDDMKVKVLTQKLVEANIPMEKVFKLYKVNSLAELTTKKWQNAMDNIEKIKQIEV